jgi:hypothetical protein
MRKKNYKGRCEKRKLSKCKGVCKTYDALQYTYADMLEADNDIVEIRCNVQLEGMDYTSDFLCIKANGEYMVRECVYRKLLTKPMTMKMLESSRQYWMDVKKRSLWEQRASSRRSNVKSCRKRQNS